MAKIKAQPYQEPEGDEEELEELSDTQPGIVADEDDEVQGVQSEGEEVEIPEGEEEEDEGDGEESAKPKYTFESEEELEKFIASRKPATTPEPVKTEPKKDDEPEKVERPVFFKGQVDPETGKWIGEKPKDWNDLLGKVIDYVESKEYKQKVVDFQKGLTESEKEEYKKIDAEFDAEYDTMAVEGLVPKRNTKEGQEVNQKISVIGGTYGLTSMKAAYDLAKKIPADQGGLLDYKPTTKKPNPSKQASKFIKSSTKTNAAAKGKTQIPYAKLHTQSMDELIDD